MLFDYFPSLLHFLNSLIKFVLRLKFFYKQEAGGGLGGGGMVLLSFSLMSFYFFPVMCVLITWALYVYIYIFLIEIYLLDSMADSCQCMAETTTIL